MNVTQVVALLFRSLISEPAEAVESSASALHKALVLGKDTEEESSSSKCHRLSKELIQSCIRPILLNLREHTKLSLPLLRGLSRLLGLLSSWFNKTLGEKLLEHLHNFGEPGECFHSGGIKALLRNLVSQSKMPICRQNYASTGVSSWRRASYCSRCDGSLRLIATGVSFC